ncbi:IS66 family insertion sequence element accessory protein TnpB [Mesorhizobium sp. M0322]|uniref:IS66 family insertion sequence element accessory protein TnpB n=1 Tax=Mesorhizobium sp. M0322 TaxID=2956937 RepID=UPI003336B40E
MIDPTDVVKVMVATKPVDFRKRAEGLAALVRETWAPIRSPGRSTSFRAKRPDRVKLVYFDGTGACLLAKRLEEGKFCWPAITDGVVRLSTAQLQALLEGLDWRRVHDARETRAGRGKLIPWATEDSGKALEYMIESAF